MGFFGLLPSGVPFESKTHAYSKEAIAKPGRDGVPSPSAAGGGTPALPVPRGFAIASKEMDKATEVAEPGYYAVTLKEGGVRCEVTALAHSAAYRFSFGRAGCVYLLVDPGCGKNARLWRWTGPDKPCRPRRFGAAA